MEEANLGGRIFFPVSSQDYTATLKPGQRYRNPFGDKRLDKRIAQLGARMVERQSLVINQLSDDKSEKASFYNVLNNDYVDLAELISHSCEIAPSLVEDKSLLVLLDTSSTSLVSHIKEKQKQNPMPGVVENNKTPGFFVHPSLVVDQQKGHLIGLGDIIIFDRPKNNLEGKQVQQARTKRGNLPLEEKESSVWSLSAGNTQKQLQKAKQVTYILDQGGDKYPTLAQLRKDTQGAHFLVRSKENRLALNVHSGEQGRLTELLEKENWQSSQEVEIRSLDHYSKSKGKRVIRQGRVAKLKIRFIEIQLPVPKSFVGEPLSGNFTVIEVIEEASTVPQGEEPIHWRLLTTHIVKDIQQAWYIVRWYQQRWFIEQLFRVYKKKGFDIEHSQFKNPDAVKRQAILGIKAASQVLQLSMARSGEDFIPIQSIFNQSQQVEVLEKVNEKLSGKTEKTTNPHPITSLAWAAWIIARLGGWNGYAKARKPGPITMHRGLKRFYGIIWANNLMNDP